MAYYGEDGIMLDEVRRESRFVDQRETKMVG